MKRSDFVKIMALSSAALTSPDTFLAIAFADEGESKLINVKQFGAKGDNVTDDSDAIKRALETDAASIYFPAGSYRVFQLGVNAKNISNKKIRIIGESKQTTKLLPFRLKGPQDYLIKFDHLSELALENISFEGEGADGEGHVTQGIRVDNMVSDGEGITLHQCGYRGFEKNVGDVAGISVLGGVSSFKATDCSFRDIGTPGVPVSHDGKVSYQAASGISLGPKDGQSDSVLSKSVTIKDCHFENIGRGVDGDAIRVVGSARKPRHKEVQISDCTFRNSSYRSIKTQAERTVVSRNEFYNERTKKRVSGNTVDAPEVDIQRGSGSVSDNQFSYPSDIYAPSVLIAVRSWESGQGRAHQHTIRNNTAKVLNGAFLSFVEISAHHGMDLNAKVTKNTVKSPCRYFASIATISTASKTRIEASFSENKVKGVEKSFVYLYRVGDSEQGASAPDPYDPGSNGFFSLTFTGNTSEGPISRLLSAHPHVRHGSNLSVALGMSSNTGFQLQPLKDKYPVRIRKS